MWRLLCKLVQQIYIAASYICFILTLKSSIMKQKLITISAIMLVVVSLLTISIGSATSATQDGKPQCKYCGNPYSTLQALYQNKCSRHPAGWSKGNCALYEGSTKSKYYCKLCGREASTIRNLTDTKCNRHPNGTFKGACQAYEGSTKSTYNCRYCGRSASSIRDLVTYNKCQRHPYGAMKGYCSPL